jgi:hypothetical protein
MLLSSFRDSLAAHFSSEELQSLCLDLGIPTRSFPAIP